MLGVLSFLAFLCGVAFLVSAVLFAVRLVKKKPWKPFAIIAAAAVVGVLALSVPISRLYVPAEKPEQPETSSAVAPTANVDNSVDSVEKRPAESEIPSNPEQSVASEATSEPAPVSPEPSAEPESTAEPESSRPTESPEETAEPESSAAPSASIAETYKVDVIVASKMTLDRFISGYSVSLAEQNWTVADFDSDGAVIAMADVTFKSSKETARAILVLTPEIVDGEVTEATPHFVAVGETVYGDDGYCDSVFTTIQEALNAFGGSE